MHFRKFALTFGILNSISVSCVLASPSQSEYGQDTMASASDAARQVVLDFANGGHPIASQGTSDSSLGSAQPQSLLRDGVGKDWQKFMPVRDSVDALASRENADHILRGNGGALVEHESLDVELVPEPASLIAWSLIGSAFGVGAWKRRKHSPEDSAA